MSNAPFHEKEGFTFPRRAFFTGAVALDQGIGLCYDQDYTSTATGETATDACNWRRTRVELPTTSNNRNFAGVTKQAYGAKENGQWIEIYEPGSTCMVAIGADTVVDTTFLTCSANTIDAGRFTKAGFTGRGTAKALQTNASGVLASNYDGSAALDSTGLILTHAGAFASLTENKSYDVYILAGEDDATNAVTAVKTTGVYLTNNTLTLADAQSDGGTMEVSYYLQDGNQMALCYLYDGEESGLQQVYQITDGANTGLMVPGFNYIHGAFTPDADATETLADGSMNGERLGIALMGALTTNDYLLTVTSGLVMAGTQLSTLEFDGDGDSATLQWFHDEWRAITVHGAAEA